MSEPTDDYDAFIANEYGDCLRCQGTGEIIVAGDLEDTCPDCDGSGWVPQVWEDDE